MRWKSAEITVPLNDRNNVLILGVWLKPWELARLHMFDQSQVKFIFPSNLGLTMSNIVLDLKVYTVWHQTFFQNSK